MNMTFTIGQPVIDRVTGNQGTVAMLLRGGLGGVGVDWNNGRNYVLDTWDLLPVADLYADHSDPDMMPTADDVAEMLAWGCER